MAWQTKMMEDSIAEFQERIPMTEEKIKWFYDSYNQLTPGVKGISKADLDIIKECFVYAETIKYSEIK